MTTLFHHLACCVQFFFRPISAHLQNLPFRFGRCILALILQNSKSMWPHNCHKDAGQKLRRIQPAIIPLTIVLLSQQAKKQFLVSTCQKSDYDAIVKTRKKGFRETAKIRKSLGIPYFKPISVLFYLFRDRRHTVSTWVETMV